MSIIKILPEHLVNQIAAGEVVERPSSVVKELVENSLDSSADQIVIELKEGGKRLIRVSDNGVGMSREDLALAIARHATSKIGGEEDLWKIQTMGFRGEALASICSVTKVTVKSKARDALAGSEMVVNGGEILGVKDVGMSSGTQITVEDLFFNTPARQKYLKKDATELAHISSLLDAVAMANPSVAFKLIHNDKVIFDLARATNFGDRIADLFGQSTFEAMLPIFYGGSAFQIDGFIGKPSLSRATSQNQYIFVNRRPIQHFLLANRIKAAYHSMLMEHKKPVFAINITIDPALIDVNVHPRKLEIRFEDEKSLVSVLYHAVKAALEKANLMPRSDEARRYMSDKWEKGMGGEGTNKMDQFKRGAEGVDIFRKDVKSTVNQFPGNFTKHTINGFSIGKNSNFSPQEALNFSKEILGERETQDLQNLQKKPLIKAISQVANCYIVAENEQGLILIDQHAAHERVRYEELIDQFENQQKSIQPLLVPQQLELSQNELILMQESMEIFKGLGFEIEPFGGNTYMVQSVPACLAKENIDEIVKGVLDDLMNEKQPSNMQGRAEEILTYMSCRSAIKFGQSLSLPEIQALIMQMEKLKRPYTCPHGRPTMISLSLAQLERMFGRK